MRSGLPHQVEQLVRQVLLLLQQLFENAVGALEAAGAAYSGRHRLRGGWRGRLGRQLAIEVRRDCVDRARDPPSTGGTSSGHRTCAGRAWRLASAAGNRDRAPEDRGRVHARQVVARQILQQALTPWRSRSTGEPPARPARPAAEPVRALGLPAAGAALCDQPARCVESRADGRRTSGQYRLRSNGYVGSTTRRRRSSA